MELIERVFFKSRFYSISLHDSLHLAIDRTPALFLCLIILKSGLNDMNSIMKSPKKSKGRRPSDDPAEKGNEKGLKQEDVERIEFHRNAFALMPEAGDKRPGVAFFVKGERFESHWHFCSCNMSKDGTCSHLLKLKKIFKNLNDKLHGKLPSEELKTSIWFRLVRTLGETPGIPARSILINVFQSSELENARYLKISDADGNEVEVSESHASQSQRDGSEVPGAV